MSVVALKDSKSHVTTDPFRNFRFHVNIEKPGAGTEGMVRLGFMSCDGLAINTDMISYREGGDNTTPRKMPGQSNFSPISLSRGAVRGSRQMYQWFKQIFHTTQGAGTGVTGNNFRTDFIIQLLSHPVTRGPAEVMMEWRVFNAWPSVLQYSTLDAGGNGVAIEQMTLEHEGWGITQWAPALATPGPGPGGGTT